MSILELERFQDNTDRQREALQEHYFYAEDLGVKPCLEDCVWRGCDLILKYLHA